ncbi:MAG: nickel pincer cofactor biosynthesis protein LarB, partial [Verrucomicrobia bacterium]|nr:nickel pincer cofactor biosynthesis protein LarB [Verrucomicrobiota bacterium]
MTNEQIEKLLGEVGRGECTIDDAMAALRDLPYEDLGHTKIDHHRSLRNGFPEVIYGAGKTPEQVAEIFAAMMTKGNVLATRVTDAMADAVRAICPEVDYSPLGRTLVHRHDPIDYRGGEVVVVTAGTSDLAVAEEARITADILGNRTKLISDVGVAGIHRLFGSLDAIRKASVVIVVAGMEGALASVVGGMVDCPIIAV